MASVFPAAPASLESLLAKLSKITRQGGFFTAKLSHSIFQRKFSHGCSGGADAQGLSLGANQFNILSLSIFSHIQLPNLEYIGQNYFSEI